MSPCMAEEQWQERWQPRNNRTWQQNSYAAAFECQLQPSLLTECRMSPAPGRHYLAVHTSISSPYGLIHSPAGAFKLSSCCSTRATLLMHLHHWDVVPARTVQLGREQCSWGRARICCPRDAAMPALFPRPTTCILGVASATAHLGRPL